MQADFIGKIFALSSALLWSFGVIFFKKAGETMRPAALNLYKSFVAAALLPLVMWAFGDSFFPAEVTGTDWLVVAASGIIGIAVADSLFFKCLNLLGAGLTAIVECLYSPIVMTLSWFFLLERFNSRQVGGALMVITAVLVATLKIKKARVPAKNVVLGIIAGFGAMFFMGIGIILMKPVLEKSSVLWVSEVRLLAGIVVLVIFILADSRRKEVIRSLKNRHNLGHALPGSLIGNFLSMTLWVAGFKLTDVSSAAILNQTNTIFIVVLASLWLKEPFTSRRAIAAALAFAGSVLVVNS